MIKRKYHVDSIEYVITNSYSEGKGYFFNTLFGWRRTDSKDYAHFLLSKKDWKIIDTEIKYYYTFVQKKGK